jgi:leucyl-tRNA synthetase
MLFDFGVVSTPEPFGKLFHQGLITSFSFQRADKSLVPTDQVEFRCADGSTIALDAVTDASVGEFIEIATGGRLSRVIAKMSKSLKNVVNPDDVIAEYGADTFRLYEMYMGPLEASKPWNTRDIVGVFRFLQRAWRLAVDERTGEVLAAAAPDAKIEKLLHRTIHKVGEDIEKLSFNTAIAAMIELVNAATRPQSMADPTQGGMTRDQLERFARILWPFAPHFADELGARLGVVSMQTGGFFGSSWPTYDPAMLVDDEIEMPVQIQGKIKARLMVPAKADAAAVEALALAHADVVAAIAGRPVKKVVVVPGRMVNVVV